MTPNQYRAALGRLGLTQSGAAKLFDISLRTSQGYALGNYPVPEAIAMVLRLLTGELNLERLKDAVIRD